MPVSNSVSLNNDNNNERESSLCTNPVENSSREKPGQLPDFTKTREHWSFFSISGWLTGNSSNSLSKGIFRKQRKAECSLLLNRVATLANYYRSVRNEKREGVQRGTRVSKESREFNFPFSMATRNDNEISTLLHRENPPPNFVCIVLQNLRMCVQAGERGLGLCNWVVACPDPDDCRVTSAPLIFSSSSFVKVSITEGTPPPFLPYPTLPRAFPPPTLLKSVGWSDSSSGS